LNDRRLLLFICYAGFVSLGLPDPLIGVAWPSIRETFGLRQGDVSWIFIGGGCSYFFSSFFAGRLLKFFNVGVLLALSSAVVGLSGVNYSLATAWPLFAAGALLHGLGSGAIDASLNHYAASHFSARHMNWLHAFYSVGAMLGPIIMTAAITRAASWRLGYAIVAGTLLSLSLLFFVTRARWNDGPAATGESAEAPPSVPVSAALRHGMVWCHIALFFVYTGLEVAVGQWSYTILTDSASLLPWPAPGSPSTGPASWPAACSWGRWRIGSVSTASSA
jgi:fucose permease